MKNARFPKGGLKLVACLLPCLLAGTLLAQDQGNGNPPSRAARISSIHGNVSFEPAGQNQWSQATLNYTLTTGDRIYTDQGADAELEVGPFTVRVGATTDLTMANLTDQLMQLGVEQGTVRVGVYELPSGNAVEIDTPNGALNALGPGSYRVDVDPNNGSRVIVDSGSLQISGGDVNQTIANGQAVQLTGANPIQVTPIDFPRPDSFDQWYESRDRRLQSFRSRRYVNPYIPGGEDLDDYGTWQSGGQYGPVWYPSGVGADWAPYREGHWAYVGPWGWTWVDDEPWGYCPFHYGRWAFVGSRWGWIPGPVDVVPVYSPALVAFVGGGGFSIGFGFGGGEVAAWFPLGPTDPFIPWYNYQGDYLRQVNITNVRNVTNITNITNVTNSTNISNINTSNIHYAYRTVATTAVPAATFRSGQSVARNAVRVTAAQLAKTQVIRRPAIAPARAAVFAGKSPVKAPPVRTARLVVPPQPSAGRPAAARGAVPPTAPATRPTPRARPIPEARPAPEAARPTMPGARPAPTPGARPTPEGRPAPEAARPAMPGARPAPTPGARPTPETRTAPEVARPAPRTRSAPEAAHPTMPAARPARPAPQPRPAPDTQRPTPRARPVPESRPTHPEARPAPEAARPAPRARPAPEASPAPEARSAAPSRREPSPREPQRSEQKRKQQKPESQ